MKIVKTNWCCCQKYKKKIQSRLKLCKSAFFSFFLLFSTFYIRYVIRIWRYILYNKRKIRYHKNQFADDEIHFVNSPFSAYTFLHFLLKRKQQKKLIHSITRYFPCIACIYLETGASSPITPTYAESTYESYIRMKRIWAHIDSKYVYVYSLSICKKKYWFVAPSLTDNTISQIIRIFQAGSDQRV